jgi:hypothetical protein
MLEAWRVRAAPAFQGFFFFFSFFFGVGIRQEAKEIPPLPAMGKAPGGNARGAHLILSLPDKQSH